MKRPAQVHHPADEKRELIHLVEHSALPVRRTLDALGLVPCQLKWDTRGR